MSIHRLPCPTCSWPNRETVGMVCQTCGWDYSRGEKPNKPEVLVPMDAGDVAHVVPVGDLIKHDISEDCACGPFAEPVKRDDGSVSWVLTHHSLDGREMSE